jgi:sorbitol-specific phosphotransferase system component IIC
MSQTAVIWALILLAFVAANLPFVNQRPLAVLPLRAGVKSLAWRLAELALWYFVIGAIGMLLAQRAGQISPLGWAFYAVTTALFLTLAFPGFVSRHLVRR